MSDDSTLLERIYRNACARLDAAKLAAEQAAGLAEGTKLLGLGKVAHAQVRAALAARPDLEPLLSVSTTAGPEWWALAGDHPVPGERSFNCGEALRIAAQDADGSDLALFLSGGGSALAAVAAEGVDEEDKARATRLLLASGLDIRRMNVVRRAISGIKGGRLALAAPRARWRVFVMSDVVGDDLASIASGPCAPDPSRPGEARYVLQSAGLWNRVPASVQRRIALDLRPPQLNGIEVTHRILASARSLARAAEAEAAEENLVTTVLAPVTDPVEALASRYARWAEDRAGGGPALLIATGEPTHRVRGDGKGGRAQHLALLVARRIAGMDATFLAAGTDGRDGPTAHAGAIVDGAFAEKAGGKLDEAIVRDDSATLHDALKTAIPQWDPLTHVGELHLLLVR